jgi:hypothetical protein
VLAHRRISVERCRASDVKLFYNINEADLGPRLRMIRPPRGFQTMKTAATLARSEITRMIGRGQSTQRKCQAKGAVCLVNQLFGLPD